MWLANKANEITVHRVGRTGQSGNTGTAVTFVTPEEGRCAVHLAKALKQSNQPIPADVQELADQFLEQVKVGKEKLTASGFGGKGLEKLDQERDATRNRECKTYKTGDERDEVEKEEKEAGNDLIQNAASKVRSVNDPALVASTMPEFGSITVKKTEKAPSSSSKDPLDRVNLAIKAIQAKLAGGSASLAPQPGQLDAGEYNAVLGAFVLYSV